MSVCCSPSAWVDSTVPPPHTASNTLDRTRRLSVFCHFPPTRGSTNVYLLPHQAYTATARVGFLVILRSTLEDALFSLVEDMIQKNNRISSPLSDGERLKEKIKYESRHAPHIRKV